MSAHLLNACVSVIAAALFVLAIGCATAQSQRADFIVPNREEFLKRLDLTKPELAGVEAALDEGDVETAATAYLTHFRGKEFACPSRKPMRALFVSLAEAPSRPHHDQTSLAHMFDCRRSTLTRVLTKDNHSGGR